MLHNCNFMIKVVERWYFWSSSINWLDLRHVRGIRGILFNKRPNEYLYALIKFSVVFLTNQKIKFNIIEDFFTAAVLWRSKSRGL